MTNNKAMPRQRYFFTTVYSNVAVFYLRTTTTGSILGISSPSIFPTDRAEFERIVIQFLDDRREGPLPAVGHDIDCADGPAIPIVGPGTHSKTALRGESPRSNRFVSRIPANNLRPFGVHSSFGERFKGASDETVILRPAAYRIDANIA